MPKVFPREEKELVIQLSKQGRTYVEIAKIMSEKYPDSWNAKTAARSIARIIKGKNDDGEDDKTLDEMTRDERATFIENKLQSTPRFKLAFRNFNDEEKQVFVEEYISVIKSTESLTEVEEQALFASVLELVLAFQALARKEREERLFERSQSGEIAEDNAQHRRFVDDRYHKEYDAHMKLYQKGMEQLKMSRSQRLQAVRSQKQTLIDLAQELSSRNAQAEVAEEVERLSKAKDEELKKMIDEGHLYGIFEDYQ
jgi:hypothetical protein